MRLSHTPQHQTACLIHTRNRYGSRVRSGLQSVVSLQTRHLLQPRCSAQGSWTRPDLSLPRAHHCWRTNAPGRSSHKGIHPLWNGQPNTLTMGSNSRSLNTICHRIDRIGDPRRAALLQMESIASWSNDKLLSRRRRLRYSGRI